MRRKILSNVINHEIGHRSTKIQNMICTPCAHVIYNYLFCRKSIVEEECSWERSALMSRSSVVLRKRLPKVS